MIEKESLLIDKSNPYSFMENNLSKEFENISFISTEHFFDYHYCCNNCKIFPKLIFDDDDIIEKVCNCKGGIKLFLLENTNEYISKVNMENNIEYLKCKIHFYKKFTYYCKKCKKNLCKDCCEKRLNHKEEIIDFNFDIDTKLSINFISDILNDNKSSIDNSNENKFESDIFNETIKLVKNQDDSNYYDKVVKKDDKMKINPNSILLELDKVELKKYYCYLFSVIINDYNEYPNFNHIENILMIEKFIIKHKNLFNEDIIFKYQETKQKINNEKKRNLPNETESLLLFYDNLFKFFGNIDLSKIKTLFIYIFGSYLLTENFFAYIIGFIIFLNFSPFYLLFSTLFSTRKSLYIDNIEHYDYFTYINKKIEFKLEKDKLLLINNICIILHIIHFKSIYLEQYNRFSSILYLIVYSFLNILSIVNYLIVLKILYRLTNSFQIFGTTLDVVYGKNGNLLIPYKQRDKFGNYYVQCRIIYFIILFHLIYFIIIIKIYQKIKRNENKVKITNLVKIENTNNIEISNENNNNKNIKKKPFFDFENERVRNFIFKKFINKG